jgi:hypothetical protein
VKVESTRTSTPAMCHGRGDRVEEADAVERMGAFDRQQAPGSRIAGEHLDVRQCLSPGHHRRPELVSDHDPVEPRVIDAARAGPCPGLRIDAEAAGPQNRQRGLRNRMGRGAMLQGPVVSVHPADSGRVGSSCCGRAKPRPLSLAPVMLSRLLLLSLLAGLTAVDRPSCQVAPCLAGSPGNTFLASANESRLNWVYAIRLRNDALARSVTAVEMFCGETQADTSVRIFGHDPVANAPAGWRGQADWWISENVGWQGAQLLPAVSLAPFETFWLVWSTPRSIQLSVEAATSLGEEHREGQFAPTGAPQRTYRWKYRLYCGGKDPGTFVTRGGPCGGTTRRAPRVLGDPSVPAVGAPFSVVMDRGPTNAPAFLGLGFQDQRLAGVLPLPIDLGTLGAPGCQIHVDLVALGAAATDGLGFARQSLTLPVQGGLVGQTFYAQWLVLSPAANTLGLVTSAGAACRIGN